MNGGFLLIGPNGMHGILELASHVLDELPESSLEYAEIFSLFQKFCGALAQKVTNWKKVRIIFSSIIPFISSPFLVEYER